MNVCSTNNRGKALPFGPFTPGQDESVYYTFYADDCLLFFNEQDLTPRQRADHEANIALTAMLQVALTYMGQSKDHVALHDAFNEQPWADLLSFYQSTFAELFTDVVPLEHYHYFPNNKFYEAIAQTQLPTDLLGLYMISGSNLTLHKSQEAWQLSKKVNSKMHFAATAPAASIPIPATLTCKKQDLGNTETLQFFAQHNNRVMVKILGLAGARNVTAVTNITEAQAYIAEFEPELDLVLQQQLDTSQYTEMTVDLNVSDTNISITNVRKILFADGLWVGNYISEQLTLSEKQRAICLKVGEYVRELGHSSPQGFNCGIDFFVNGDDIVVIEINARWTGGLFPAHLIKRLKAEHEHSVAFIDIISTGQLAKYQQFIRDNLHGSQDGSFRLVPMGFSPFVQDMDGEQRLYVWQVVIGDYEHFKQEKNAVLGANELPTADAITLDI